MRFGRQPIQVLRRSASDSTEIAGASTASMVAASIGENHAEVPYLCFKTRMKRRAGGSRMALRTYVRLPWRFLYSIEYGNWTPDTLKFLNAVCPENSTLLELYMIKVTTDPSRFIIARCLRKQELEFV